MCRSAEAERQKQKTVVSQWLVARDFPSKDLKEFVAYVKANAQKLNIAHAGVGSIGFTCGLLFNSISGVKRHWYLSAVSPRP